MSDFLFIFHFFEVNFKFLLVFQRVCQIFYLFFSFEIFQGEPLFLEGRSTGLGEGGGCKNKWGQVHGLC